MVRQVDQDRVSHSDQSGNQTVYVINSRLPDCLHAVKCLPSMGHVSPVRACLIKMQIKITLITEDLAHVCVWVCVNGSREVSHWSNGCSYDFCSCT